MEYYLAIKRKEGQIHARTWMILKNVLLSERSQTQKDRYCVIPLCEIYRMGRSMERENRLEVARGFREERMGTDYFEDIRCCSGLMKKFCN